MLSPSPSERAAPYVKNFQGVIGLIGAATLFFIAVIPSATRSQVSHLLKDTLSSQAKQPAGPAESSNPFAKVADALKLKE